MHCYLLAFDADITLNCQVNINHLTKKQYYWVSDNYCFCLSVLDRQSILTLVYGYHILCIMSLIYFMM